MEQHVPLHNWLFQFFHRARRLKMSVQIDTAQHVGFHVDAFTATGAPAILDALPVWVSSDEAVATVGATGVDVTVTSVGVGACTITVSATSFGHPVQTAVD